MSKEQADYLNDLICSRHSMVNEHLREPLDEEELTALKDEKEMLMCFDDLREEEGKTKYLLIGWTACEAWHTFAETRHAGDVTITEFKEHCGENHIKFMLYELDLLTRETLDTIKDILFSLEGEGRENSSDYWMYQFIEAKAK